VLFCSGNRFERLPPSLGDCMALSQVGFRGCGIREVPAEALPPNLRWLTLTDNTIEGLPEAIGRRPALQKVMLAGNRLQDPARKPGGPRQAGTAALGGQPVRGPAALVGRAPQPGLAGLGRQSVRPRRADGPGRGRLVLAASWAAGGAAGASGDVHEALWTDGGETRPVAVKLFKGAMTSDGLPEREMAACLAAGAHPNLTSALGRIDGHPDGVQGLLMPLLPADWRVLAGPPSLESCSRDVYDPALRLDLDVALRIARDVGTGAAHLHAGGLSHGDLYAHNTLWDGQMGAAVLSDFGAASFLPDGPGDPLARLDVLAWGRLLGEVLALSDEASPGLRDLQAYCEQPHPAHRPGMAEAVEALAGFVPGL
jgi:hypothetical protein